MFVNPNVRAVQTADGPVELVDPVADLSELMFSRAGVGLVVGADLFLNGGELLGTGFDVVGDVAGAAGEVL